MDGKCQYCGKDSENVVAHERFCGKNPNNVRTKRKVVPTQESQSLSADSIHPSPDIPQPKAGAPDTSKSFVDRIMEKIAPASDFMKEYRNFFGKLPKFEAKPPGFFKRLTLKRGLTYKTFVFVDKDGKGEIAYLPYDAAKQRVVVDKVGYWPIEVKGDIIYLSKEFLLPLAQVPNLSRFQNSANYVWSVYNGGYQEGLSQRFDELMDEINKERVFKWICLAVAVLALIALAVTAYADSKTIGSLIEVNRLQSIQLINFTKVH